jgi:hypothetical protein
MNIEVIHGGGLPELGVFLGSAIDSMPPTVAQAMLGGIFANIVGNISDENWEALKQAAQLPCECGDPDCKVSITAVIEAGDKARKQFKKCQGEPPSNSEEKGFSV